MRPPEEIIAETFRELDKHLRLASVAQIGGFRPPDDPVTSWFGGKFVGQPGETWPIHDSKPMWPLLQVRTDELPYRPAVLDSIALFAVFIDAERLPVRSPAPNGHWWLMRSYSSVEGLTPLRQPELNTWLRPLPIRWELRESDGPAWEDAWMVFDLTEFNELDEEDESFDPVDLFYGRYSNHKGTKIGGWPALIQHELDSPGEFVFQIASEEKPNWMWGDNGKGYFCREADETWTLDWQCY